MKKLLLALALFLLPTIALAQCNGVFPANTTCGTGATAGFPGPLATSTFARTKLLANTTFFVRSDGSDSLCTGTTNAAAASAPNCAFLTWNGMYTAITQAYDFGGKTVTLKSGTTNTYPAGLFMSVAWVGGGQLIIDLAGSSIAETVTKGVINDVVQPGQITLINSSGLGVGGNISSTGFACVQNDQPSDFNIGVAGAPGINGISTGPCFDAHYEATQTGSIYFAAPVNIKGAGGNELFLIASGSTIGLNAQTFNICSNQTYSLGTAVVQTNGNLQANSAVFNLNPACGGGPYTVTGPRYNVTLHGTIYTANAGINFFPGTTTGATGSDSGGCYDSICYGSLADGTPFLGSLLGTQIATPGSPAAGKVIVWADSSAAVLQSKSPAGAVATMVFSQAAAGNLFVTGVSATTGGLLTAQPTFSNLATGTAPAFTLGGTVSGGGNQINNVVIGAVTPLAGTFTQVTSGTYISSTALTWSTNGGTFAGGINTSQQWLINANNITIPAGVVLSVGKNTAALSANAAPINPDTIATFVNADNAATRLAIQQFGTSGGAPSLIYYHARGTAATPTATQSGNSIGANFGVGYQTTTNAYGTGGGAGISMLATENYTSTTLGAKLQLISTPTGTSAQVVGATLQASGCFSVGSTGADCGTNNMNAVGWVQSGTVAVASLPTCNAAAKGARHFVTDANATFTAGIGTTVAGGGANNVPVTCDGTNWRIGANDNIPGYLVRKYA